MCIVKKILLSTLTILACVATLALCACGANQQSGKIRIGTMPTEDILPMWVAEQEGLFKDAGVDAEIVVFDSAPALSSALTAGEVDIAMTDPMRAAKLCESGTDLSLAWVTLGTTPEQGRFGVLVLADSGYKKLSDLASDTKGVGLASNTVPEYVFDMLCKQQGIDPASIPTSQVPSLPDRFGLVSSGQLDAAALPGSLLALGEAQGMIILADDSTGNNISQSVMVVRKAYNQGAGAKTLEKVRKVWDEAVAQINANPENYRALLIEKANLNDKVASTYPISEYPLATVNGVAAYPSAQLIEPVLAWMKDKGYTEKTITYNEADGSITIS